MNRVILLDSKAKEPVVIHHRTNQKTRTNIANREG